MRRVGGAVAALALAMLGADAAAAARPAASDDTAALELVRQTVSVPLDGRATFGVRVTGAPEGAELEATVFVPVSAQGILDAERGQLPTRQVGFVPRAPLSDLAVGDGTVAVSLTAVDRLPELDEEVRMTFPGVYPVRLRLLDPNREGPIAELTTFLIRPARQKLPITVVLPLPGQPSHLADGRVVVADTDVARAQDVTELLAALPQFPFTLAPRPELLDALHTTKPVLTDRLGASLGTRAVLAMPYVRVDVPGMVAADLRDEISRQWKLGEDTVGRALPGSRPDRRAWLVDSPVDARSVDVLRTLGVQQVLIAADRLTPAPASPVLHPVPVRTADAVAPATAGSLDTGLVALVDDGTLDTRLTSGRSLPVTVVNLVAELTARAFGDDIGRGLVLVPTTSAQSRPDFWKAFADAVDHSGMLEAVDLDTFVRVTSTDRSATYALPKDTSRNELALAQGLFVTRVALDVMGSVLPTGSPRFGGLTERTTMAVSADLDDGARQAYFDQVTARVNPVRQSVSVRVRDRVTLAGKAGVIPLSLVNALDEPVTVKLRLVSPKIEVPDNDRVFTIAAHDELPVRMDVRALTSAWEFPVTVQLSTPVGGEAIGTTGELRVRAVGLSGLGLGISAGALVVLVVWWLGHSRSRRRAKRAAAASLPDP